MIDLKDKLYLCSLFQVVMRREKVNVAAEFAKERGGAQHKEVLNLVVIGRLCASGSVREFFCRIRVPIPDTP